MNIFVSNLGFNMQDADLESLFSEYGSVKSAKVVMDRETGKSRGFGFVEISDDAIAQKAIKELDKKMVQGRALQVNEARPKNSSSSKKW